MNQYFATVQRIIDGDTIVATIDLGLNTQTTQRLRLADIDAPEQHTPTGQVATIHLRWLLPAGTQLLITTDQTDQYGRWLAHIHTTPTPTHHSTASINTTDYTRHINNELVTKNHAEKTP